MSIQQILTEHKSFLAVYTVDNKLFADHLKLICEQEHVSPYLLLSIIQTLHDLVKRKSAPKKQNLINLFPSFPITGFLDQIRYLAQWMHNTMKAYPNFLDPQTEEDHLQALSYLSDQFEQKYGKDFPHTNFTFYKILYQRY